MSSTHVGSPTIKIKQSEALGAVISPEELELLVSVLLLVRKRHLFPKPPHVSGGNTYVAVGQALLWSKRQQA